MKRHRTKRSFRPRLEVLEDRRCLSCTVTQEGSTVFVIGDQADDQVTIVDHGRSGVTVDCLDDDRDPAVFTGVTSIQVQTDAGNDLVTFQKTTSDTPVTAVIIDLAAAAEVKAYSFTAELPAFTFAWLMPRGGDRAFFVDESGNLIGNGCPEPPCPPDIHIAGSFADLVATLDSVKTPVSVAMDLSSASDNVDLTVANAAAPVDVHANMGGGNDSLHVHVTGVTAADVCIEADLGDGDDRFEFDTHGLVPKLPPPPDPFSLLKCKVAVGDSLGNDWMIIEPEDIPGLDQTYRLDCGGGDDRVVAHMTNPSNDKTPVGRVQLEAFGREGDDALHFYLTGSAASREPQIFNGSLAVNLDGGGDSDTFGIGLGSTESGPIHVNGPLAVNVNGGGNSDSAVIAIVNVALNGAVTANVDLGAGDDFTEWVFEDVLVTGSVNADTLGGGGNDSVEWVFQGVVVNGEVNASASGGAGVDDICVDYEWQIAAGGHAQLSLIGGAGNDMLHTEGSNHIARDGAFDLFEDGGAGDDEVGFSYYEVQVDGMALVHLMGSAGNDTLNIALEEVTITGQKSLYMDGGLAEDHINLDLHDVVVTGLLTAETEGGFGNDTINVAMLACDIGGELRMSADAGAGDDSASVFCSNNLFEMLELEIDMGAGHDRLDLETTHVQFGQAALSAHLGAGNDVMGWQNQGTTTNRSLVANSDGGAGADAMFAELNPLVLAGGVYQFRLDGGRDNDAIVARLQVDPESQGRLGGEILGSAGNDTISARLIWDPGTRASDTNWSIMASGGDGNDAVLAQVDFLPQPLGATESLVVDFLLRLDGGDGNDVLAARVDFTNVDENDHVRAVVELFGGLRNDILGLDVVGKSNPNEFEALVDGGAGFDIAFVPRGVLVRNCEVVSFPPGQ